MNQPLHELYPHYHKDVRHLNSVDIYRIFDLWEVTDPCAQHAIKKLMAAGKRGAKDSTQDFKEARDTLNRKLQMLEEDSNKGV